MKMSFEQLKEGIRNGTVMFCLPAAHAEFSNDFLEDFSCRILKKDWREILECAEFGSPSLLVGDDSEDDLVAAILANYGADVSDLPGLPLWEVIRRCTVTTRSE
jgi:hypothetical protein